MDKFSVGPLIFQMSPRTCLRETEKQKSGHKPTEKKKMLQNINHLSIIRFQCTFKSAFKYKHRILLFKNPIRRINYIRLDKITLHQTFKKGNLYPSYLLFLVEYLLSNLSNDNVIKFCH